jgi:hypothetical protein
MSKCCKKYKKKGKSCKDCPRLSGKSKKAAKRRQKKD